MHGNAMAAGIHEDTEVCVGMVCGTGHFGLISSVMMRTSAQIPAAIENEMKRCVREVISATDHCESVC